MSCRDLGPKFRAQFVDVCEAPDVVPLPAQTLAPLAVKVRAKREA